MRREDIEKGTDMAVTNSLNLPKPFVDAATKKHEYTPKRYSVTSILKGTTEAVLQRRHANEIDTDVADCVWMIFGSAVHSILEQSDETKTQLKENYLTMDMPNGYVLSGIFDLYDDATGTVTDYKTASVWKAVSGDWEDYRKQTLLYCLMLREIGFDARRGEIVALLKDHSKSKAKYDRTYPQHPVVVMSWDFSETDFDNARDFVYYKFEKIERFEKMPDYELPPCNPDRRWNEPAKWAVMKKGRKKAVKLFELKSAADFMAYAYGPEAYIELRPEKNRKCEEYCTVSRWCRFYREHYASDLVK